MRLATSAIVTLCWLCTSITFAQMGMISVDLDGQTIEGRPLAWDDSNIFLLQRDGSMAQFNPANASNYRQTKKQFESYPQGMLRSRLMEEFGSEFEVSGTGTYLVVHPRGQRRLWADRFESLYRSMFHYYRARQIPLHKPEVPLIAVVLRSHGEFSQHAQRLGMQAPDSTTKGLYHVESNRILVFDHGNGNGTEADWYANYSVVIHESAHQTAFNIGLHRRFGATPLWLVEGVGTLFEAPGVYDPRNNRELWDRVNAYRYDTFLELLPHRPGDTLSHLVASDRLFEADWRVAYANAWALTFYLSEREPRKLAQFIHLTNARPQFVEYTTSERLKDFTQVFGNDWEMFDAHLVRYIQSIKK